MENVDEMSRPASVERDQKIETKEDEKILSGLSNENVIGSNNSSDDNLSISTSLITSDEVAAQPKLLSFLKVGRKDIDSPKFSNLNHLFITLSTNQFFPITYLRRIIFMLFFFHTHLRQQQK